MGQGMGAQRPMAGLFPRWRQRDPDQRVLAKAKAGHAGAFDVLRARHEEAVTTFCRGMLERVQGEPEEVVEETFATARRELPATRADLQVRPWLYALAFERCVDRLNEERAAGGSATASAQGEEQDQRRAAALMMGSLPDTELAGLLSLADGRPSLFGLAGELVRSAPKSVGKFAMEEAATEAVTALVLSPFRGGGAGDADAAAHQAARLGGLRGAGDAATRSADRVRRAATTAAVSGSAIVLAGTGALALTDAGPGGRDANRSTPIAGPGSGSGAPVSSPLSLDGGTGGTRGSDNSGGRSGGGGSGEDGSRGRGGRGADGRGGGDRGDARAGRDGRDGSPGRAGSGGRDAVRDLTRFLPGGGGGGGGGDGPNDRPSGGGGEPSPEPRSLLRLRLEAGPVDADVRVR